MGDISFQQQLTPTNPQPGFNKLYFKGDNTLYTLDSGGTETPVGSNFNYSLVTGTGGQGLAGGMVNNLILWLSSVSDTLGFWNFGDPTKLTVPAGVTKIKLKAQVDITGAVAGKNFQALLLKNGSSAMGGLNAVVNSLTASGIDQAIQIITPVITVAPGDYFELSINTDDVTSPQAHPEYGFFEVEVVG